MGTVICRAEMHKTRTRVCYCQEEMGHAADEHRCAHGAYQKKAKFERFTRPRRKHE